MKRLAILISSLSLVIAGLVALGGTASAAPVYCGPGAYNAAYRAVYNYPTGSYWTSQIAAYPDYYTANNAFYMSLFHC